MSRYAHQRLPYETPPELAGGKPSEAPVIVVGAGPIGLAAAIELAQHGIASVLVDDNDQVSHGSRAICWAKRSLEILDRLGVGQRVLDKGVTWQVGRLFHRDAQVYAFDLLPEEGHRMPAFVNLQQYYMEAYLIDRARELSDRIDLRWNNRVVGVEQDARGVRAEVETPDGRYTLCGDYLLACDGAKSPIRNMLGLEFGGQQFEERFLIADVRMQADFPSERWFWFEPPFHPGQSTLLHKQPDDIYRIDFQLGPDADPEAEKQPERVRPRVAAMVGHEDFELDWVSVYSFKCCRLARFVHDRVVFAGDSAHVVSPFGARGGNGGLHDVDNLGWKLAAVVKGEAPAALLDTYDQERIHGADENILNSARATGFMTPKTATDKLFRDAVLGLAAEYPFARRLVNSGRLSVPCSLAGFDLQTPAEDDGAGVAVGAVCPDAPVDGPDGSGWLLHHLGGDFVLLAVDAAVPTIQGVRTVSVATRGYAGTQGLGDRAGWVEARYGGGKLYLIRPDQHVAARFDRADRATIQTALKRAQGMPEDSHAAASHA